MSLRIIYGRAGTGKSEAIYQEIQEKIQNHSKHPITIITPEQFSFTAEQKLLATSPSHSVIQAEVVTFARMAYRILNEVGGKTKTHLSSSGRAMLIDYILLTQKEKFSFLGKSDENVEMMARQLTELKKHMVTSEKLEEVIANTQEEYLKRKLQDITKLYESYIEKIQSNYIDENDGLTILATQLEESTQFQNHDIYIDEFGDEEINKGPKYFILTAIIVEKTKDLEVSKVVDKIKDKLYIKNNNLLSYGLKLVPSNSKATELYVLIKYLNKEKSELSPD